MAATRDPGSAGIESPRNHPMCFPTGIKHGGRAPSPFVRDQTLDPRWNRNSHDTSDEASVGLMAASPQLREATYSERYRERKPAADLAIFISVSPTGLPDSTEPTITVPYGSPWTMMGAMTCV